MAHPRLPCPMIDGSAACSKGAPACCRSALGPVLLVGAPSTPALARDRCRRRYTGGKKAGVDAYLAPELARCPSDCVAYTPAGERSRPRIPASLLAVRSWAAWACHQLG